MSDTQLWSLDKVTLHGTSQPRLDSVSLTITPGITAILGWSGCGKTSLLNLLTGFEQPNSGSVQSEIGNIQSKRSASLPLYWVPQEHGLWPHLTFHEHVAVVRNGLPDAGPVDWLAKFDLNARADALPAHASVGERARLSVARALAANAEILVMDEPLAHVDRTRVDAYWRLTVDHVRAQGSSLVYATHAARMVLGHAERVAVLRRGRLVFDGAVETLYWQPPTAELAEALGAANWFAGPDVDLWLGGNPPASPCIRPQHLRVQPDPNGPLVVTRVAFAGALTAVCLRHTRTGAERTVHIISAEPPLQTGTPVRLAPTGAMEHTP